MNASTKPRTPPAARSQAFQAALGKALEGEVRFDAFTRGRYATDASIYQIMPRAVAFPLPGTAEGLPEWRRTSRAAMAAARWST